MKVQLYSVNNKFVCNILFLKVDMEVNTTLGFCQSFIDFLVANHIIWGFLLDYIKNCEQE